MRKVQSSDLTIGRNLRALRNRRGMSQTELANQLGITFQQVQKYEKGSNRISASTLLSMAKALNFNVMDFFANAGDGEAPAVAEASGEQRGNKLDFSIMRRLTALQDDKIKRKLLQLLDSIAEAEQNKVPARMRPDQHP